MTAYTSKVTFTRPANTTAYTAGDVVGPTAAAIEFASFAPPASHFVITDADLRIDVAAVPSGMTTFKLHLYDATPPSALADNAAWDLPAGDRANYLGFITLDPPVDMGSTLFISMNAVNKKLKLGAGSTSLFGYLVTTAGFTPSSATVKTIRLNAIGV